MVNVPQNGSEKYKSTSALGCDEIVILLKIFSVWQNKPSVQGCLEFEFLKEMGDSDIDKFQDWIRWSIGTFVPDLIIERI